MHRGCHSMCGLGSHHHACGGVPRDTKSRLRLSGRLVVVSIIFQQLLSRRNPTRHLRRMPSSPAHGTRRTDACSLRAYPLHPRDCPSARCTTCGRDRPRRPRAACGWSCRTRDHHINHASRLSGGPRRAGGLGQHSRGACGRRRPGCLSFDSMKPPRLADSRSCVARSTGCAVHLCSAYVYSFVQGEAASTRCRPVQLALVCVLEVECRQYGTV